MKLVKSNYKILEQKPGLEGIYEQIELAGRTCYRSKRPEGQTAKDFVDRMIASKHYAMLEHGAVYLHIKDYFNSKSSKAIAHYTGTDCIISTDFSVEDAKSNPYTKCNIMGYGLHGRQALITTNFRVLVENGWLDDLQYLCEPTEYHEKRVTVRFTTGVDISRELNRHRVNSIAEQSTRYCNFSKNKFGNEITCIIPSALTSNASLNYEISKEFKQALEDSEKHYFKLLELGWKPENARKVLPLDLATELVHTAFVSDWKHLFSLRSSKAATGKPHPDCVALIDPLKEEFVKRNYLKEC